jgi:hypothetical protein
METLYHWWLIVITIIGHLLILNLLNFLQLFNRCRKVYFRFKELLLILEVVFVLWIYLVLIVHICHSLIHLRIILVLLNILLGNNRRVLQILLLFRLLILHFWGRCLIWFEANPTSSWFIIRYWSPSKFCSIKLLIRICLIMLLKLHDLLLYPSDFFV